jgi:CRISPR-associated endonuclease/helicase Cas3
MNIKITRAVMEKMCNVSLPVSVTSLCSVWGKFDTQRYHHLAHHCADVAACFEKIAELPVVRARLEKAAERRLSEGDIARLAVLVFLHDCGKLHPGFQAKGWPEGCWKGYKHGHIQEGVAIFSDAMDGQLGKNLKVEQLIAWGLDLNLLYAVLAHHGRPFKVENGVFQRWCPVPEMNYDPCVASKEIGDLLPIWFQAAFVNCGEPLPIAPHFQHLFCGFASLADWLGSETRIFEFSGALDHQYINTARERAVRAIEEIGLNTQRWHNLIAKKESLFSVLTGGKVPRPAQKAVGEWSLDDQLVILEAETGSGKTEAALLHFARLFQAGKVDSLYFAVPTRAAAKQIHGRVNNALKNLFGVAAPEAVLAVPGYLKVGEVEGKALPHFQVLWDDDENGENITISRWSAENTKRYLAAPVAVGTVDQAMLAALQVKHAHLRAASLSRSLLVVDEVHASDRYMSEVQLHLLTTHRAYGGFALLMSATLGAMSRVKWLKGRRAEVPSFTASCSSPYPAIWGSADEPQMVASDGRSKTVFLTLAESWEAREAADRAIAAATKGAKVLIIRNTVKAALETFEAICQAGQEHLLWQVAGGPVLHHSRFAPEDRKMLDSEVELALSPDGNQRQAGGVIVIGTQTLEQSLDIDSDVLITDLCPVDVLLQRIGRLHRHKLPRPSDFEKPQCVVLSPAGGLDRFAAPAFENGLGQFRDGGGVYRNLHACELTRRLVLEHPQWCIPEMNRFLVESATHDEPVNALNEELGKTWAAYWNDVYGRDLAEAGSANRVKLKVDEPFIAPDGQPFLFVSDEEKIRTRLGAEGAAVRFTEPYMGPFGNQVTGITLPAHWSKGIMSNDPVPVVADDGVLLFEVGGKMFTYGRRGLETGTK